MTNNQPKELPQTEPINTGVEKIITAQNNAEMPEIRHDSGFVKHPKEEVLKLPSSIYDNAYPFNHLG